MGLRKKIREKRRLRRRFQKSQNPADKRIYYKACKEVRFVLRGPRKQSHEEHPIFAEPSK